MKDELEKNVSNGIKIKKFLTKKYILFFSIVLILGFCIGIGTKLFITKAALEEPIGDGIDILMTDIQSPFEEAHINMNNRRILQLSVGDGTPTTSAANIRYVNEVAEGKWSTVGIWRSDNGLLGDVWNANLGNVGIGTTDPATLLHVDGTLLVADTFALNSLYASENICGGYGCVTWNSEDLGNNAYPAFRAGAIGIGTDAPGTSMLKVCNGPIEAAGGLIIETRADDPDEPEDLIDGRMWLITP